MTSGAVNRDSDTRPVRDCEHPNTRHEHGSRNAYVCDRCRCRPCTDAATAYASSMNRQKAYGRYGGLVDAEPVRAHIRALSDAGVGLKRITRLSGVSGGVLTKLVYGHPRPDGTVRPPSRRCTPHVRDRILAIPVTSEIVAPAANVDGTGTRRRLEALMTLGWSQSALARRLGMAPTNFGKVLRCTRVQACTRDAVRTLYDELWNTRPPETGHRQRISASRARRAAQARGYAPPLAWDDDTIDNPDAQTESASTAELDEIAVERYMAGTLQAPLMSRSPERLEAILRLQALGLTDRQIGDRVGMNRDAVTNTRLRHQRKEAA